MVKRIRGYEQQGHGPIAEIHYKYDTTATTPRVGRDREAPFDPAEGGRGGRRLFDRGRLNISVNPTLGRADAWGNEKAFVPRDPPLGSNPDHSPNFGAGASVEVVNAAVAKQKRLQAGYREGLLEKKPGVTVYPVNTSQRFEIDKRAAQFHATSRVDWSNVKPGDHITFDIKVKPFKHKVHHWPEMFEHTDYHFPEHGFTRISGWVSANGRSFVIGHTGRAFSYMKAEFKYDSKEGIRVRGKSPGLGVKSYMGVIKWAQGQGLKWIDSGGQVSREAGQVYRALKEMGFKVDIFEDKGQSGNYRIHVPDARLPESVKPVLLGSDKATFDNYWRAIKL